MNSTSIASEGDSEMSWEESPYGYIPTRYVTLIFIVWFGVSTLLHLFQAIRGKTWFMTYTVVLGGIGEVLAWVGRFWSSNSPSSEDPFMMQISAAILAPTPLLAAIFIITGIVITQLGPSYSRLSPRLYSAIFLTSDVIALIIQAVGGAMASTQDDPRPGANIMLGGIVFQTVVIIAYTAVSGEFLWRYLKNRPIADRPSVKSGRGFLYPKLKWVIAVLAASITFLFIRAIYRVIELSEGWDGHVLTTEWYFNVFDGVPVGLTFTILNVCHPGWFIHPVRDLFLPDNIEMKQARNTGSQESQASTV